jgi:hypothetical protein
MNGLNAMDVFQEGVNILSKKISHRFRSCLLTPDINPPSLKPRRRNLSYAVLRRRNLSFAEATEKKPGTTVAWLLL